ncbi:hypothetical protein AAMO2058_000912300 [Amorphochlora amoebiformis]
MAPPTLRPGGMAVRRVWHVCGPRGGLGGALVLGFVILLATVGPKPALLGDGHSYFLEDMNLHGSNDLGNTDAGKVPRRLRRIAAVSGGIVATGWLVSVPRSRWAKYFQSFWAKIHPSALPTPPPTPRPGEHLITTKNQIEKEYDAILARAQSLRDKLAALKQEAPTEITQDQSIWEAYVPNEEEDYDPDEFPSIRSLTETPPGLKSVEISGEKSEASRKSGGIFSEESLNDCGEGWMERVNITGAELGRLTERYIELCDPEVMATEGDQGEKEKAAIERRMELWKVKRYYNRFLQPRSFTDEQNYTLYKSLASNFTLVQETVNKMRDGLLSAYSEGFREMHRNKSTSLVPSAVFKEADKNDAAHDKSVEEAYRRHLDGTEAEHEENEMREFIELRKKSYMQHEKSSLQERVKQVKARDEFVKNFDKLSKTEAKRLETLKREVGHYETEEEYVKYLVRYNETKKGLRESPRKPFPDPSNPYAQRPLGFENTPQKLKDMFLSTLEEVSGEHAPPASTEPEPSEPIPKIESETAAPKAKPDAAVFKSESATPVSESPITRQAYPDPNNPYVETPLSFKNTPQKLKDMFLSTLDDVSAEQAQPKPEPASKPESRTATPMTKPPTTVSKSDSTTPPETESKMTTGPETISTTTAPKFTAPKFQPTMSTPKPKPKTPFISTPKPKPKAPFISTVSKPPGSSIAKPPSSTTVPKPHSWKSWAAPKPKPTTTASTSQSNATEPEPKPLTTASTPHSAKTEPKPKPVTTASASQSTTTTPKAKPTPRSTSTEPKPNFSTTPKPKPTASAQPLHTKSAAHPHGTIDASKSQIDATAPRSHGTTAALESALAPTTYSQNQQSPRRRRRRPRRRSRRKSKEKSLEKSQSPTPSAQDLPGEPAHPLPHDPEEIHNLQDSVSSVISEGAREVSRSVDSERKDGREADLKANRNAEVMGTVGSVGSDGSEGEREEKDWKEVMEEERKATLGMLKEQEVGNQEYIQDEIQRRRVLREKAVKEEMERMDEDLDLVNETDTKEQTVEIIGLDGKKYYAMPGRPGGPPIDHELLLESKQFSSGKAKEQRQMEEQRRKERIKRAEEKEKRIEDDRAQWLNSLPSLLDAQKAARKNKEKIGGGFGEKFRHFSTDANGPDPGAMSLAIEKLERATEKKDPEIQEDSAMWQPEEEELEIDVERPGESIKDDSETQNSKLHIQRVKEYHKKEAERENMLKAREEAGKNAVDREEDVKRKQLMESQRKMEIEAQKEADRLFEEDTEMEDDELPVGVGMEMSSSELAGAERVMDAHDEDDLKMKEDSARIAQWESDQRERQALELRRNQLEEERARRAGGLVEAQAAQRRFEERAKKSEQAFMIETKQATVADSHLSREIESKRPEDSEIHIQDQSFSHSLTGGGFRQNDDSKHGDVSEKDPDEGIWMRKTSGWTGAKGGGEEEIAKLRRIKEKLREVSLAGNEPQSPSENTDYAQRMEESFKREEATRNDFGNTLGPIFHKQASDQSQLHKNATQVFLSQLVERQIEEANKYLKQQGNNLPLSEDSDGGESLRFSGKERTPEEINRMEHEVSIAADLHLMKRTIRPSCVMEVDDADTIMEEHKRFKSLGMPNPPPPSIPTDSEILEITPFKPSVRKADREMYIHEILNLANDADSYIWSSNLVINAKKLHVETGRAGIQKLLDCGYDWAVRPTPDGGWETDGRYLVARNDSRSRDMLLEKIDLSEFSVAKKPPVDGGHYLDVSQVDEDLEAWEEIVRKYAAFHGIRTTDEDVEEFVQGIKIKARKATPPGMHSLDLGYHICRFLNRIGDSMSSVDINRDCEKRQIKNAEYYMGEFGVLPTKDGYACVCSIPETIARNWNMLHEGAKHSFLARILCFQAKDLRSIRDIGKGEIGRLLAPFVIKHPETGEPALINKDPQKMRDICSDSSLLFEKHFPRYFNATPELEKTAWELFCKEVNQSLSDDNLHEDKLFMMLNMTNNTLLRYYMREGWLNEDLFSLKLPENSPPLDPDYPLLTHMDGLPIDAWVRAAMQPGFVNHVPKRSRKTAVELLYRVAELRQQLGIPPSDYINLTLRNVKGDTKMIRSPLTKAEGGLTTFIQPNEFPTNDSKMEIACIQWMDASTTTARQLTHMLLRSIMSDTKAMIIDIRGASGYSHMVLDILLHFLNPPGEAAKVVLAAALRLPPERRRNASVERKYVEIEGEPELRMQRFYPKNSAMWTDNEREVIEKFEARFKPRWGKLNASEFSKMHYKVAPARPWRRRGLVPMDPNVIPYFPCIHRPLSELGVKDRENLINNLISRYDTDDDGRLSFPEFVNLVQNTRETLTEYLAESNDNLTVVRSKIDKFLSNIQDPNTWEALLNYVGSGGFFVGDPKSLSPAGLLRLDFQLWNGLLTRQAVAEARINQDALKCYHFNRPLVILADENTLGTASYCVSALRAFKNVAIVGAEEGGAGTFILAKDLPHSSLRFTVSNVAVFHRSGRIIEESPSIPDIPASVHLSDVLNTNCDNQLTVALQTAQDMFDGKLDIPTLRAEKLKRMAARKPGINRSVAMKSGDR